MAEPQSWDELVSKSEPAAPSSWDDLVAESKKDPGYVGEAVRGVKAGLKVQLPKMAGQALQFFGAEDTGRKFVEDAEARNTPALQESAVGQAHDSPWSVRGNVYEAATNAVPSLAPGAAGAAAGAALGSVIPGAGTAVGALVGYAVGSIAALPMFYGSQAKESYDAVKKTQLEEGKSEAEADAIATKTAHAEGAIEAGGEVLADVIPFAKLFKPVARPVAKAAGTLVMDALVPTFKQGAKTAAGVVGAEVATEMAQQAGEDYVRKEIGGTGEGATWSETSKVIMPTAIMSAIPGMAGAGARHIQRKAAVSALTDPETDPETRSRIAMGVSAAIQEADPTLARNFAAYAARQIHNDEPIEIGKDTLYEGQQKLLPAPQPIVPGAPADNSGTVAAAEENANKVYADRNAHEARQALLSNIAQAQAAAEKTGEVLQAHTLDDAIESAKDAISSINVPEQVANDIRLAHNGRTMLERMEKQADEDAAYAEREAQSIDRDAQIAQLNEDDRARTQRSILADMVAKGQGDGPIAMALKKALGVKESTNAIPVEVSGTSGVQRSAGPANESPSEAVGGGNAQPVQAAGAQEGADRAQAQVSAKIPTTPEEVQAATAEHLEAARNLTRSAETKALIEAEIARRAAPVSTPEAGTPATQQAPIALPEAQTQGTTAPATASATQTQQAPVEPAAQPHPAVEAPAQPERLFGRQITEASPMELRAALKHRLERVRVAAQQELDRRTVKVPPELVGTVREMAKQRWFEEGGKAAGGQYIPGITRKTQAEMNEEGTGRTNWVGKPVYAGSGMSQTEVQAAVERAIAGQPMGERQRRVVQGLVDEAQNLALTTEQEAQAEAVAEEAARLLRAENWNTLSKEDQDAEFDSLFGKGTPQEAHPSAAAEGARAGERTGAAEARQEVAAHPGEPGPSDDEPSFSRQRRISGEQQPELALTGQTETEIKAEELKRARDAEEKRRHESAPPPEEFTLTGSSRAADEAAARGQNELFDQGGLFRGEQPAEKAEPAPESEKPAHPITAAADALIQAATAMRAAVEEKPAAKPAGALDAHDAVLARARDGELTLDEFKAAFESAVTNKSQIVAELAKLTKDQLSQRMGVRYNDPKDRLVRMAYSDVLQDFTLSRGVSYVMGEGGMEAAVKKMVAETTEKDLADFAERVRKARSERTEHRAQFLESIKDPKTLEDFERFLKVKKESDLTPAQLRLYDDLRAAQARERRASHEATRARVETAGEAVGAAIIETKHTKKGHDLFVVQLEKRVERDDYNRLNIAAKRLGGYYSSFRGAGAVPGFQFTTRENADAFQKLAGGDATAATDAVQERRSTNRETKKNAAAERLADMADRMEESARERLSAERLTNTARRARMASSAEAQAAADERMAKTLRAISDAIESGTAKNLDGIRNRAQIEELESLLTRAKYAAIRAEKDGGHHFEEQRDRAPRESDVPFVEYPHYRGSRSDFAAAARRVVRIPGAKLAGERLLKLTDDSKDYAKAISEDPLLLHRVMLGKHAEGSEERSAAMFNLKGDAEAAVRRSGMRSNAMVVPLSGKVGKGMYAVVLGPAEAKGRGIWSPKEDPKIAVPASLMEELMDKVNAHNEGATYGAQINLGYYFDNVRESRKRLHGMGLDSTPELRAALREYIDLRAADRAKDRVKELERALAGNADVGIDFFPTPAPLAARMTDALELKPGMTVLEPSAGKGNLADAVRTAEPGAQIDTVEQSSTLRKILEAKGYPLVGHDFMEFHPEEKYDRVIMNPPFSSGIDAQHVMRAYDLLKPGGRMVAITGEGIFFRDDARSRAFREWFDSVGGTSEQMDEAFTDRRQVKTTGVASRLLVIDKPDSAAMSRPSEIAQTFDHNAEGQNPRAYRRAEGRYQALKSEDVRRIIAPIIKNWGNAPKIRVIATLAEAPEAVRRTDEAQREGGATGEPEAFIHAGTVYMVADGLASEASVVRALFHESFGHFGLRGVLGDRIVTVLNEVVKSAPKRVEAKAKEYGLDFSNQDAKLIAAEEVLAEIAQTRPTLGIVRRAVAVVRQFLRELGLKIDLSDSDIIANYILPAREFVTAQRSGWSEGRTAFARGDDAMFSRAEHLGTLTADQEAALRNVHGDPATWRTRLDALKKDWKKNLVQGIFDQYAPILDLSPQAYRLARMSKGGDSTLESLLMYDKVYVDKNGSYRSEYTKAKGFNGFAKVLASLHGEQDRFFEWVAALRAERLKSIGLENLYSDKDISTLKTLNQGAMKDGTTRGVAYANALKQLNEWNDSVLKIAADSGLIDEATRKMYEGMPYVPFYRLQEEGTSFGMKAGLVNQSAWKKLKGGTAHLNDDLLANVLQNWSHLITASAKNRAAKATLEAAVRAKVADEVPSGTPGKGLVGFKDNGKERVFRVSDPHLMDAIGALDYAGAGPWAKPFSAMKRALTIGVTVNPAFKIRNLIRDSIQAIGTAELSYNPAKNIAQGYKAFEKESEVRAQLLAAGGAIRFGSMLDGNNADRTRRLIEQGVKPEYILDDASKVTRFWKERIVPAFEAYQEFGDRGEQISRAALYEQLLAKGMSHEEASFWARDLLDFSLMGKWNAVRTLSQIVPFWNARLQGIYKLGRATKADYKRMGTTLGAVALSSIALLLAYGDDDDWKKREEWDRENYWWFKVGGIAFRIPKPFEVGAIGTLAERSVEYLISNEMTGKRFAERMAATVFNQLSMNPTPQLVKPLMDIYANKDSFTDRPIETMGMEKLRKQDRATERTTELAKFLGSLGMPDPTKLVMGRWDTLSPVQIEALVRGYFGWLGTSTTVALDWGIRPMMDRGQRPDMQLRDVFLAGNFAETLPSNSSRYVTRLYDQATEIEQAYGSYRDAMKRGDLEHAKSIRESEAEKLRQYGMVETIKRRESLLNEQARRIEASKDIPGDEKRRRLDLIAQRKNDLARALR